MIVKQLLEYFQTQGSNYLHLCYEHLFVSLSSLLIAVLLGVPLGFLSSMYRNWGRLVLTSSQLLRVIPSLAILFILIPIIGVGKTPAIIALVVLGIPPIMINTCLGFNEISTVMIETGEGLGMTQKQLLKKVKFPLALPFILTGIKLALIEIIASATLATYIGAGGLGTLIFTGLGLYRIDLLLVGGLSVALLSFGATVIMDLLIKRREYQ